MILFVGNVDHYLKNYAKKIHTDSILIEKDNLNQLDSISAGYISLGDHSREDFFAVMDYASEIYYVPVTTWEYEDTKRWTETFLSYFYHKKPVYNFVPGAVETNMLDLTDVRKSDNGQIWSVGCSISHGLGVKANQRWGQIVADAFDKNVSFLTMPASSIEWASKQILRSDIRKDDIVIWGLTGISRISYYSNEVNHIYQKFCDENGSNEIFKMINPRILLSDHVKYLALSNLDAVINFSNKVGFQLIILYLPLNIEEHELFMLEHLSKMKNFIYPQQKFIDFGTDKIHPGPLTHQMYADDILKFYKENYQ